MNPEIRLLGPDDAGVLARVAPDVFDHEVRPDWAAEFLADPRHHLAVALDGDAVIGFASGVHYVHPDKPPELWINEVGVTPSHQGRGVGRALVRALLDRGRALGCEAAWVATEASNRAARRLYAAAGGTEEAEPVVVVTFPLSPPG